MSRLFRAVALASLIGVAGCSFFLQPISDDWTEEKKPDCHDYVIVPIADAIIGVASLVWAVSSPCQKDALNCGVGLIPGAAFGSGAVIGYFRVTKCRGAKEEHRAWSEGQDF